MRTISGLTKMSLEALGDRHKLNRNSIKKNKEKTYAKVLSFWYDCKRRILNF